VVLLQQAVQVEIVDHLAHLVYQDLLVQQVFQVRVEVLDPLETVVLLEQVDNLLLVVLVDRVLHLELLV